jgi:hypothetical protein
MSDQPEDDRIGRLPARRNAARRGVVERTLLREFEDLRRRRVYDA